MMIIIVLLNAVYQELYTNLFNLHNNHVCVCARVSACAKLLQSCSTFCDPMD